MGRGPAGLRPAIQVHRAGQLRPPEPTAPPRTVVWSGPSQKPPIYYKVTSLAPRGKMIHTLNEPILTGRTIPTIRGITRPTSVLGSVVKSVPWVITLITLLPLQTAAEPTPLGSIFHCLYVS